jgi:hypothetical protein
MRFHVLTFIRKAFPDTSSEGSTFEYRLTCSGILYRNIIGDWARSDIARVLSPEQFYLFACSARFEEYPQELSLRFTCPSVTENYGSSTFNYRPDEEIASDLAALLTVFCRRFTTVAGKLRESYKVLPAGIPDIFLDRPFSIYGAKWLCWPSRPASVITGPELVEGEWRVRQEVQSHNPRPFAVEPCDLTAFLNKIGQQKDELANAIIIACRRYHEALRYIPENADISYLLLVSAIEALAAIALEDYRPPMEKILEGRKPVRQYLKSLSLTEEEINQVIQTLVKDNPWTQEKFIKFIENNIPDEAWDETDSLYPGLAFPTLIPQRINLRKALVRLYKRRSARSHSGKPYPAYVTAGTSPLINNEAFRAMLAASESEKVPPVIWFERVVQGTIYNFINASVETDRKL